MLKLNSIGLRVWRNEEKDKSSRVIRRLVKSSKSAMKKRRKKNEKIAKSMIDRRERRVINIDLLKNNDRLIGIAAPAVPPP